jgi:hypothetical protein
MLIAKRGKWHFVVKTLPLGGLSSRSAFSALVVALFKKFSLYLNRGVYREDSSFIKF